MDSKITKKRLSNFLSYEWIVMLIFLMLAIFVFEIFYTSFGVRLKPGQTYGIMFDTNIEAHGNAFSNTLGYETDNSVFSYDVLEFSEESNSDKVELLETRFAIKSIDILFTDNVVTTKNEWDKRVNLLLDYNFSFYTITKLRDDMKVYLLSFMNGDIIDKNDINNELVKENFLSRMKGDNRYRTEQAKEKGIKQEIERIQNLCKEYYFFVKAYDYGIENDWFYKYHQYEYAIHQEKNSNLEYYKKRYNETTEEFWGINIGALTGGKDSTDKYFEIKQNIKDYNGNNVSGTKNIVMIIADYGEYQTDLQFETVAVINTLIRNCVSQEVYMGW